MEKGYLCIANHISGISFTQGQFYMFENSPNQDMEEDESDERILTGRRSVRDVTPTVVELFGSSRGRHKYVDNEEEQFLLSCNSTPRENHCALPFDIQDVRRNTQSPGVLNNQSSSMTSEELFAKAEQLNQFCAVCSVRRRKKVKHFGGEDLQMKDCYLQRCLKFA